MNMPPWHAEVKPSYSKKLGETLCGADAYTCDSTHNKAMVTCKRCMATKKWKSHVGRYLHEGDFNRVTDQTGEQ